MWVCSLYREDPLEEEMATHSSILTWRIPWTEEPGRLQPDSETPWTVVRQAPLSMGFHRVKHD